LDDNFAGVRNGIRALKRLVTIDPDTHFVVFTQDPDGVPLTAWFFNLIRAAKAY
jgi:Iap family predicted aminopeptidase